MKYQTIKLRNFIIRLIDFIKKVYYIIELDDKTIKGYQIYRLFYQINILLLDQCFIIRLIYYYQLKRFRYRILFYNNS